jgi:hypothetical protein
MTEEEEIEQLLAQSPAPRVTIDSMTARIADVTYTRLTGGTMTICQITIDNGFVVIGESACVNPENYNQVIGEKIAYNHAFNKLWPLFGFLLAETLYQKGSNQGNG